MLKKKKKGLHQNIKIDVKNSSQMLLRGCNHKVVLWASRTYLSLVAGVWGSDCFENIL